MNAHQDTQAQQLKKQMCSTLLTEINRKIDSMNKTQVELAALLQTTQPRVSALRKHQVDNFRLDMLVNYALRLKLKVEFSVC